MDTEDRLVKMGFTNPFALSKQMKQFAHIYHGTFLAYDEGLKRNDVVLAEAFYRNIFTMKNCLDIYSLRILVEHTHKELNNLFQLEDERILRGYIKLNELPFEYEQEE